MKILIKKTGHANCDSLPLRFGLHFDRDTELVLANAKLLKKDEKYPDRLHYSANFDLANCSGLGNFVVSSDEVPRLITVWGSNDRDTEQKLSDVIRSLRESEVLTSADLLKMHPDYKSGRIRTHANLIEVLADKKSQPEIMRIRDIAAKAELVAELAIQERNVLKGELERALNAIEVEKLETSKYKNAYEQQLEEAIRMNKLADQRSDSEIMGAAKKITDTWQSKTGSAYLNFGIEAYVAQVDRKGDQIQLTYINERGEDVVINDFGYNGFVGHVYDYLKSKLHSRAVFVITHKPNGPLKLASDTMLLNAYKHLWAT